MENTLHIQCAWCNAFREYGNPPWIPYREKLSTWKGGAISHGICPACKKIKLEEIAKLRKERLDNETERQ